MINRYTTLFIAAAGCLSAHAQISINAVDNAPVIGDSFTYNTATFAAAPAGGADQLFDYSSLVSTGTSTFEWVTPSVYSNGALFSGAQMASINGTDTVFYTLTASGLERVGEFKRLVVFGNTIDLEILHTNNLLEMGMPLAFSDSWSDDVEGTVDSDGSIGDRNGVIQGVADASGSILLPGEAEGIPVLRVFTNLQEVIQIPISGNPTNVAHKRKQYDYYAPFLKMPILSVYSDSLISFVNVVENGIRWMNTNPVGVAETASLPMEVALMPNPAEEQVTVNMAVTTGADAMIFVADAAGRVVLSERITAGVSRWDLDTRALANGCYAVTVTDRTGAHGTARLVKR